MRAGLKPWKSLSEEALCKAAAAWNWTHDYFARHRGAGVGIGQSKMSKLVLPLTTLRETSGTIYASMANFSYAALALRLLECTIEGIRHFKFIREPLAFLYIVDATEWDVIPYEATRLPGHGIVMAQSEDPIPLMRHTLRQPKHSLHEDDFQSCLEAVRGKRMGLATTPKTRCWQTLCVRLCMMTWTTRIKVNSKRLVNPRGRRRLVPGLALRRESATRRLGQSLKDDAE